MIGETLIDAARASLESVQRGADGVAPPVAILWTDADGQWQPIIPALRNAMPQLYVLGSYDPKTHTGPVIWLKCIVEHTLRDAPEYCVTPVLYLPRVSRQDLRAGGDCPPALQPLVELQYRGAVWHQKNGRDWTVDAFLSSESGCGLDIARDNRTQEAMLRALPLLAIEGGFDHEVARVVEKAGAQRHHEVPPPAIRPLGDADIYRHIVSVDEALQGQRQA